MKGIDMQPLGRMVIEPFTDQEAEEMTALFLRSIQEFDQLQAALKAGDLIEAVLHMRAMLALNQSTGRGLEMMLASFRPFVDRGDG